MLITIAIFILTIPVRIMVAVLSIFAAIMPTWMNDAITQVMGNSGFIGSIVPMQAHPGMWGLAGETGIMPILGFIFLIAGYYVTIRIVIYVIALFMSFLPWHTSQVKQPHNVN